MGDWRRHAIYFAPPGNSALMRFANGWLGWDPEAGVEMARTSAIPSAVVAGPARYGFHATLKAPFRLAASTDTRLLDEATATIAAAVPAFSLRLEVATIGGFVALVPAAPSEPLARLEAALVTGLDHFRAPLTDREVARRRPDRLHPEERTLLDRWGYPYVLDRFRFHMTLTSGLEPAEAEELREELARELAPLLSKPMPVREVCRFSEAADGRFHLLRRFALAP